MIPVLFNILLFVIPLTFYKSTSELFEFNKVIVLYGFTTIIALFWFINNIKSKKIIFKKTILDIPLVIYLFTLLLSTLFSIDSRTSLLGYYSRFNGGLYTQLCYAVLYWAFVSNMTAKQTQATIRYSLISTAIASVMAVLEHFGTFSTCGLMGMGWKESCWIQDVQSRVFSTLGQPNWLAALLVALIPITWLLAIKETSVKRLIYSLTSLLFFVTLLFTGSRSGFLAFGVEAIILWGYVFWKDHFKHIKLFAIQLLVFGFLSFAILGKPTANVQQSAAVQGPSLETGGTESGTIRKHVWLGAIEVFKKYPILGTGPETFAFSFPMFKPIGHNLTSEWDFIYNKAHNEFLNYLATTGIVGTLAYFSVIYYSIFILFKSKRFDLLAGYVAILVSNFFGFSVVAVSLLFYIFPAFAIAISDQRLENNSKSEKLNETQFIFIVTALIATLYILFSIHSYWQADIYFQQAKTLSRQGNPTKARTLIEMAIKNSKNEPIFWSEASNIDSEIAVRSGEEKKEDQASNFIKLAIQESNVSTDFAPYNINFKRTQANVFYKLSAFNQNYLDKSEKTLKDAVKITPNDPKIYYQLGIVLLKTNKNQEAIQNLVKSIELKTNYKDGRFALGSVYKDMGEKEMAIEQFTYILDKIDSKDDLSKKYLLELK